MDSKNLIYLDNLCAVLIKNGVVKARVGDVEITFGPKSAIVVPETSPEIVGEAETAAPGTDLCRCGHSYSIYHDENVGCIEGCDIALCIPKESK